MSNIVSTSAILEDAKNRISDPEKWTYGSIARNQDGNFVRADSPNACRWCSIGSMLKSFQVFDGLMLDTQDEHALDCLYKAVKKRVRGIPLSIADFNDSHSHAEVMQVFDDAIQISKGGIAP